MTEAQTAQSKRDFLAKMYIAYKETSETIYWIRLLGAAKIISEAEYQNVIKDAQELLRLLSSITKSTEERMRNGNTN